MKKRIAFDMPKALQHAWDILWANNLRQRKDDVKYENKVGKKPFNWARTYYICAADVERTVRDLAEDSRDGKPWRTTPGYGGYGSGIRFNGNLQSTVRDWLFGQCSRGILTYHNFGRGHISGARFRPVGEPMADAEKETVQRKTRERLTPRPRHYSANGYGGTLKCMEGRKRSPFSRGRRTAYATAKQADVTCPRCRKALGLGAIKLEKRHGTTAEA